MMQTDNRKSEQAKGRMMYIDPDGQRCRILLSGNSMAMVEYPNGYICFWLLKMLRKEQTQEVDLI